METNRRKYLELTAAQLVTASRADEIQIGLLQAAARRFGLTTQELNSFVVDLSKLLISSGLVAAEYSATAGWQPLTGAHDEILQAVAQIQRMNPENGYSLWFIRTH